MQPKQARIEDGQPDGDDSEDSACAVRQSQSSPDSMRCVIKIKAVQKENEAHSEAIKNKNKQVTLEQKKKIVDSTFFFIHL